MTEHKHAEVLRAIADGKDIEFKSQIKDMWMEVTPSSINPIGYPCYIFRIKPQEIETVWGNIPKPFRPDSGQSYWTFEGVSGAIKYSYEADYLDRGCLALGFMWETEADAIKAKEVISKMMWSQH